MDPNDLSITAPDYSYFTYLIYYLEDKNYWMAGSSEEVKCKLYDD